MLYAFFVFSFFLFFLHCTRASCRDTAPQTNTHPHALTRSSLPKYSHSFLPPLSLSPFPPVLSLSLCQYTLPKLSTSPPLSASFKLPARLLSFPGKTEPLLPPVLPPLPHPLCGPFLFALFHSQPLSILQIPPAPHLPHLENATLLSRASFRRSRASDRTKRFSACRPPPFPASLSSTSLSPSSGGTTRLSATTSLPRSFPRIVRARPPPLKPAAFLRPLRPNACAPSENFCCVKIEGGEKGLCRSPWPFPSFFRPSAFSLSFSFTPCSFHET